MEKAPEVEAMSAKANEDLARLCGSEEMAERVKKLWADLMEKKRLDVSKQRLSDTEVGMLLKGLYSMARTTGFQTERMKPLPITELDFSGNELTAKGIDEVVQFARTAGANATLVDLSDNRLDDAATNELARLVKNYKCAAAAPPPPRHRPHPSSMGRRAAPRLPPTSGAPNRATAPPLHAPPPPPPPPPPRPPACCRPQLVCLSEAPGRAAAQRQRDWQGRSDQANPVRCISPPYPRYLPPLPRLLPPHPPPTRLPSPQVRALGAGPLQERGGASSADEARSERQLRRTPGAGNPNPNPKSSPSPSPNPSLSPNPSPSSNPYPNPSPGLHPNP